MADIPDVDIDVANREAAVLPFEDKAIPAVQIANGVANRHTVGLYLQRIPANPLNGCAAFDYHHAEELGYYKVDVITNSIYRDIESQDQLRTMMAEPIDWDWFQNPEFVKRLFHISNYADLMQRHKPCSIMDLAILLALIRPAKKYLKDEPWVVICSKIWEPENLEKGQSKPFKKSHAVAYALALGIDARVKAKQFFVEREDDQEMLVLETSVG
jgi:hypothetical protein